MSLKLHNDLSQWQKNETRREDKPIRGDQNASQMKTMNNQPNWCNLVATLEKIT